MPNPEIKKPENGKTVKMCNTCRHYMREEDPKRHIEVSYPFTNLKSKWPFCKKHGKHIMGDGCKMADWEDWQEKLFKNL